VLAPGERTREPDCGPGWPRGRPRCRGTLKQPHSAHTKHQLTLTVNSRTCAEAFCSALANTPAAESPLATAKGPPAASTCIAHQHMPTHVSKHTHTHTLVIALRPTHVSTRTRTSAQQPHSAGTSHTVCPEHAHERERSPMVVECRGGGWIHAQPFVLGLAFRRDARLDFRVDPGLHDVVLRLGVPHQQHLHACARI
jgi:hypothetical protein